MARLINKGKNAGLISGKMGGLVYVIQNGKNYVRKAPEKGIKHNFSNTQQAIQSRFKMASMLTRELLPVYQKGHPQLESGHYPKLMKQLLILLNSAKSDFIDWANLKLSSGQIGLKIKQQLQEDHLKIRVINHQRGYEYHYVILNQEGHNLQHFYTQSSDYQLMLGDKNRPHHIFLFVVHQEENEASLTYYLGAFHEDKQGGAI